MKRVKISRFNFYALIVFTRTKEHVVKIYVEIDYIDITIYFNPSCLTRQTCIVNQLVVILVLVLNIVRNNLVRKTSVQIISTSSKSSTRYLNNTIRLDVSSKGCQLSFNFLSCFGKYYLACQHEVCV